MVTDEDVRAALPPRGLVRDFVLWAGQQTSAPLAYHLTAILPALAVTCPSDMHIQYAGPLAPHFYGMAIGESGHMKTAGISFAKRLLRAGAPALIGANPTSYEGLVDALAAQPRQLHVYGELGSFFSRGKQAHFEPVKAGYTEAYDGGQMTRARAAKKGERNIVIAPDCRISVMSAISLSYLEQFTTQDDWEGGLLGRFFMLYSKPGKIDPWPKSEPVPEHFINQFELRARVDHVGEFAGRTPAAEKLWAEWWEYHQSRRLPPLITGMRIRLGTLAAKIAMIYAWDFGAGDGSGEGPWTGKPWHLTEKHFWPAIQAIELYVKSTEGLSKRIAKHSDARTQRRVLATLIPGEAVDLGTIAQRTQMAQRSLVEVINTLVLARRLGKATVPGSSGPVYFLLDTTHSETAHVPADQ